MGVDRDGPTIHTRKMANEPIIFMGEVQIPIEVSLKPWQTAQGPKNGSQRTFLTGLFRIIGTRIVQGSRGMSSSIAYADEASLIALFALVVSIPFPTY